MGISSNAAARSQRSRCTCAVHMYACVTGRASRSVNGEGWFCCVDFLHFFSSLLLLVFFLLPRLYLSWVIYFCFLFLSLNIYTLCEKALKWNTWSDIMILYRQKRHQLMFNIKDVLNDWMYVNDIATYIYIIMYYNGCEYDCFFLWFIYIFFVYVENWLWNVV